MDKEIITYKQYALLHGKTVQRIYKMVEVGNLTPVIVAGKSFLYNDAPYVVRKAGRPKKVK